MPALGKSRLTIGLDAAVSGRLDMCSIDRLRLDIGDKGEYVTALAEVSAPGMNREEMSIGLSDLRCYVKSSTVVETVELLVPVNRQLRDILAHIEYVDAHMQGRYTPDGAELHCDLSAAPGSLSIDGSARGKLASQSGELVLTVRTPDLAVGAVAPARASLGNGSFSVDCNAVLHRGKLQKLISKRILTAWSGATISGSLLPSMAHIMGTNWKLKLRAVILRQCLLPRHRL